LRDWIIFGRDFSCGSFLGAYCALLFLESQAQRAKKLKGFLELGSWLGFKLVGRIILFRPRQVVKEGFGDIFLLFVELPYN
jgi:hypothetical protein